VFCPRCGNNNDNNARFCFSCGQRFQQGNQPTGPSGPQWGQFQDPAPAPPPPPRPVAAPPPPRVVQTQIAPPPPPVRRTNPALAVAIIAGLVILIGGAFVLTRDDGKSGGPGVFGGAGPDVPPDLLATRGPGTPAPNATPGPAVPDGPVVAPGYKMTAIFVPAQGSNATPDVRLYDAIVQGVDWNDSAKLYGRRYPLQYVFNNATTNLLLKPPNLEQSKRLLAAAGYANSKPKFLVTFNPSDRAFGVWLTGQINNLGFNVVTDANNFSAEEKAKGYHGMIVAVLP
jgi:hypothetical protein